MKNRNNILVINPGSTSTKIAIFVNNQLHKKAEFTHDSSINQLDYRYNLIKRWVEKEFNLKDIDAIVGRGGLLKPIKSGVYKINKKIVTDLYKAKYGEHASNLGALIADKFSKLLKAPAFIVDPVTVDELIPEARITGLASIKRKSIFHALNQKAVAKRFAEKIKKPYRQLNLIVAHLGGGITIGAHKAGKVVEVNNGLEEGPFTPERAGNLPIAELIKL
ncbi:MAG: butyrate kinase, partial [Candidatus Saganbacteria bacterium]